MSMSEFVHKPSFSILEFIDFRILKAAIKMDLLKSISVYIKKHFKNQQLIQLLEFPVLRITRLSNIGIAFPLPFIPFPIIIPSGYSLQASTNNAEAFIITAFGGDF